MPAASEALSARAGSVELRLERRRLGPRPLLLLHGMSGSARWWDRSGPLLSGFDAAALEFRGHGDSGRSADGTYSFDAFAEDVDAARAALGWDRLSLAAHSMGARAAIRYAATRPERIEKLVLIDFLAQRRGSDGRFGLRRSPRQPTYGSLEDVLNRFRLEPPGTLLSKEELRELGRASVRPSGGRWTWKFDWRCFTLSYPPVWTELAAIRAPALVVRGEHSTVMPRADFERAVRELGARGVEIPRAHHHVPLDAPAELARAMLEFL